METKPASTIAENGPSAKAAASKAQKKPAPPKTGIQAVAEEIMAKAKKLADDAEKNTRVLRRQKEAIANEIKMVETTITAARKKKARLIANEKVVQEKIDTAQAGSFALLRAMDVSDDNPASISRVAASEDKQL